MSRIAVVGIGAVATLFGLVACLGYADHLMWLGDWRDRDEVSGPMAESVATVGGRALLVVSQTLSCLLFTVVGAVAMRIRDRDVALAVCVAAAVLEIVWLLACVAGNWKPGWYFILDPKKPAWPLALIVSSVAQALAWVIAAGSAAREKPRAP